MFIWDITFMRNLIVLMETLPFFWSVLKFEILGFKQKTKEQGKFIFPYLMVPMISVGLQ